MLGRGSGAPIVTVAGVGHAGGYRRLLEASGAVPMLDRVLLADEGRNGRADLLSRQGLLRC